MAINRDAAIALTRFGLGPKPGDLARIASDPRGAVLAQIGARAGALVEGPASAEDFRRFHALRAERQRALEDESRQARSAPAALRGPIVPAGAPAAAPAPGGMMQGPEETARRAILVPALESRIGRLVSTDDGATERLVAFWSNHFAVSLRKGGPMMAFAPALEREAIRPHVYGRFADMLAAVVRHPAMIFYLDNQQSMGPNSVAGRRRNRGLNENLAREILELHTLGVAGGYTQADVTAFASALTGWSFAGREHAAAGAFLFQPNFHEPGPKTILGKTYPESGEGEVGAIIADLAVHRSTARHIATKLASHFIADQPPAGVVARLERAFRDSGGDLSAVARALVTAPESWSAAPTKLRTPQEFVIAAVRATGAELPAPALVGVMANLGQPVLAPPSPKGFPDDAASWLSGEGIKSRLDWAQGFARRFGPRLEPLALAGDVVGASLTDETSTTIRRAETRAQALALLLMSPEFQRR